VWGVACWDACVVTQTYNASSSFGLMHAAKNAAGSSSIDYIYIYIYVGLQLGSKMSLQDGAAGLVPSCTFWREQVYLQALVGA
jgi:hypothetical protein